MATGTPGILSIFRQFRQKLTKRRNLNISNIILSLIRFTTVIKLKYPLESLSQQNESYYDKNWFSDIVTTFLRLFQLFHDKNDIHDTSTTIYTTFTTTTTFFTTITTTTTFHDNYDKTDKTDKSDKTDKTDKYIDKYIDKYDETLLLQNARNFQPALLFKSGIAARRHYPSI
jgi:hypothetical protein